MSTTTIANGETDRPTWWPNSSRSTTLYLIAAIAFGVLVLVPLLMLVKASFLVEAGGRVGYALAGWREALANPGVHSALANTFGLMIAAQAISIPLAILLSWLLGRTDLPARHWLEFGFWVSFFLPSLAVVQGWVLMLDSKFGLLNEALRTVLPVADGPFNIYSWWGIVFAHLVTTTVSAKVMTMTPAFHGMDARLEEAARMAGDSPLKTLVRIVVPILAPAILVTSIMGVIRALESFEIELVLGLPSGIQVYSTFIYNLVHKETADYTTASALGILMILPMLALVAITRRLMRGDRFTTISGQAKSELIALGAWRWPAFAFVALVVVMLTLIPVAFLCVSSIMSVFGYFNLDQTWTLDHWKAVLQDPVFFASARSTLVLATATLVVATVFSTFAAYAIVRGPARLRAVFDLLSWVPFTMPGVLFSFAILWSLVELGLMKTLYGSTAILVLVVTLGTLTLGVQLVRTNFMQIGSELEQASWISGASWLRTVLKILVPLSIRSLVVVAVMAFISAARNISHLALLVSSNNRPLAVLQLDYMMEGRYEEAAVIGIIVVAFTVGIALLARQMGFTVGPRARAKAAVVAP
ncbi:MAG TPA: iron ABC transporter permease [Burkholderiales bacterium]|nr:iron ABC transporter permease [Burkholderiales bacterium]